MSTCASCFTGKIKEGMEEIWSITHSLTSMECAVAFVSAFLKAVERRSTKSDSDVTGNILSVLICIDSSIQTVHIFRNLILNTKAS